MQILDELHSAGHYLGALRPERILIKPDVCLLDMAAGMARLLAHLDLLTLDKHFVLDVLLCHCTGDQSKISC